jgi:pyridoxal phosphate enzyme (YggS family)
MLKDNVEHVRQRIARACRRCERDPASVTLVAVTKGMPAAVIQEATALGLTELGENRVQEARLKQSALGSGLRARWHLIGHLQRNKAKDAVELFDVIHSVDSLALIQELERHVAARRPSNRLQVLIQVNISGEATKSGCRPDEVTALAEAIRQAGHLMLAGLMTIPPLSDDAEAARPIFRRLHELRDTLEEAFANTPTRQLANAPTHLLLSMGMSNDFEVAIEEGADLIRVGTAIFGDRRQETGDK